MSSTKNEGSQLETLQPIMSVFRQIMFWIIKKKFKISKIIFFLFYSAKFGKNDYFLCYTCRRDGNAVFRGEKETVVEEDEVQFSNHWMNAVHKATDCIFCVCIRKVRNEDRWRNIIQLAVHVAHGHYTPSTKVVRRWAEYYGRKQKKKEKKLCRISTGKFVLSVEPSKRIYRNIFVLQLHYNCSSTPVADT